MDYEAKEHPAAVFFPSHLNTKGLIFKIIVFTQRYNPPPEGRLQMLMTSEKQSISQRNSI